MDSMIIKSFEFTEVIVPAKKGQINSEGLSKPLHMLPVKGKKSWSVQFDELPKLIVKLTPHTENRVGAAKKTIASYFGRAGFVLGPRKTWNPVVKKLIREQNIPALEAIFRNSDSIPGYLRGAPVVRYTSGHVSGLLNNRGVVPRGTQPSFFLDPDRQFKADLKRAQAAVGKAKGGWAHSIIKLGGRMPGWIAKHAAEGRSTIMLRSPSPYIKFINKSRWANRAGEPDRITRTALRGRAQAIATRLELAEQRRVQKAMDRAGKRGVKLVKAAAGSLT